MYHYFRFPNASLINLAESPWRRGCHVQSVLCQSALTAAWWMLCALALRKWNPKECNSRVISTGEDSCRGSYKTSLTPERAELPITTLCGGIPLLVSLQRKMEQSVCTIQRKVLQKRDYVREPQRKETEFGLFWLVNYSQCAFGQNPIFRDLLVRIRHNFLESLWGTELSSSTARGAWSQCAHVLQGPTQTPGRPSRSILVSPSWILSLCPGFTSSRPK